MSTDQTISANGKPTSDLFDRAFCDAGTPRATCGFCGREHIASDGYLEEGELARFRGKAKVHPDGFLEFDCNSVSIGELDGVIFVAGCPCHKPRRYEDFIWRNRRGIIDYLKSRAAEAAKNAAAVTSQIEGL